MSSSKQCRRFCLGLVFWDSSEANSDPRRTAQSNLLPPVSILHSQSQREILIVSIFLSCGWIGHLVRQRCPRHVPPQPVIGTAHPGHRQADWPYCLRWLLRRFLRHPPAQVLYHSSEAHIPHSRRHCKSLIASRRRNFLKASCHLGLHYPLPPSRQGWCYRGKEEVRCSPLVFRCCIRLQSPHRICPWYRESLVGFMLATVTYTRRLALRLACWLDPLPYWLHQHDQRRELWMDS